MRSCPVVVSQVLFLSRTFAYKRVLCSLSILTSTIAFFVPTFSIIAITLSFLYLLRMLL